MTMTKPLANCGLSSIITQSNPSSTFTSYNAIKFTWRWFFHPWYYFLPPITLRERRYISNIERVLSRVFKVIDDRGQRQKRKSRSVFCHSHKKRNDSLETRTELAVPRIYVENQAILEPILLYRASKCKQTKEQGREDYLWTHIFIFL